MATPLTTTTPPPIPNPSTAASPKRNDAAFTVSFTTPSPYASRLSALLTRNSLTPLWAPTISTSPTPQTLTALAAALSPASLSAVSAVAFPSRTAVSAFAAALPSPSPPLPPAGPTFTLAALGSDAELLNPNLVLALCSDPSRVRVSVPAVSTPSGMVADLGAGGGRRVLCPVPRVVGLTEPPVVPRFLEELSRAGWDPVRVDAYETRWVGPGCLDPLVGRERLDGLVFTSIAEVEGFLKGLEGVGLDWRGFRRRWPGLVVAAHGPVTADGAERLGVDMDVVSGRFGSFEGVVEALELSLTTRR